MTTRSVTSPTRTSHLRHGHRPPYTNSFLANDGNNTNVPVQSPCLSRVVDHVALPLDGTVYSGVWDHWPIARSPRLLRAVTSGVGVPGKGFEPVRPRRAGGFKPPASAVPPPGPAEVGVRLRPAARSAVVQVDLGLASPPSASWNARRRGTDPAHPVADEHPVDHVVDDLDVGRPRSVTETTAPPGSAAASAAPPAPGAGSGTRERADPDARAAAPKRERVAKRSAGRPPLESTRWDATRSAVPNSAGCRRLPARRSEHDREILRLAVPAFGALVAEPLYLLADTAIVGNLGVRPLGGLAVAGIVLTAVFGIFNFLAYSTTGASPASSAPGNPRPRPSRASTASGSPPGSGSCSTLVGLAARAADRRRRWARPRSVAPVRAAPTCASACSAPRSCSSRSRAPATSRGMQDTTDDARHRGRREHAEPRARAAPRLRARPRDRRLGVGHGRRAGRGRGRVPRDRPPHRARGARAGPARAGRRREDDRGRRQPPRRAHRLAAPRASSPTTAVAARISDVAVAAHQIAFQIWTFLALTLDAIAIAGQALVGRFLGGDDDHGARAASRRMLEWGIVAGRRPRRAHRVLRPLLVAAVHRRPGGRGAAEQVLVVRRALQPVAGAVFVLDGILIGAGDSRYLAAAMAVATLVLPPVRRWSVLAPDGGLLALWAAFSLWVVARLVGMGAPLPAPIAGS